MRHGARSGWPTVHKHSPSPACLARLTIRPGDPPAPSPRPFHQSHSPRPRLLGSSRSRPEPHSKPYRATTGAGRRSTARLPSALSPPPIEDEAQASAPRWQPRIAPAPGAGSPARSRHLLHRTPVDPNLLRRATPTSPPHRTSPAVELQTPCLALLRRGVASPRSYAATRTPPPRRHLLSAAPPPRPHPQFLLHCTPWPDLAPVPAPSTTIFGPVGVPGTMKTMLATTATPCLVVALARNQTRLSHPIYKGHKSSSHICARIKSRIYTTESSRYHNTYHE
jgi:hypothetical protein